MNAELEQFRVWLDKRIGDDYFIPVQNKVYLKHEIMTRVKALLDNRDK